MKILEFEITKAELCIIVGEWWVKHHGDPMQIAVESFDQDWLKTISFRTVES